MQILLLVLSLVFAVVPLLLFLGIVWWLDRYDREPVWLLGLAFGWGATGAILGALVFGAILQIPLEILLTPDAAEGIAASVIAPLVEEPSKGIFLLAVYFSRYFDNTTDGFIYGAAVGLGFGMTENFLYFSQAAAVGDQVAWGTTVAIRTLYTAVMHACASSVLGAGLGFVKFRGIGYKLIIPPIAMAIAVAIHALWNGLIILDGVLAAGGVLTVLNLLLFPLEFAALLITLQVCLYLEKRMIRRELADEAVQGWLPQGHVQILSSTLARNRKTWLPREVNQARYVVAATTLAFRKHQARGSTDPMYASDVSRLRAELQGMLKNTKV